MHKDIVYLKETTSYNDILTKEHTKMPTFIKKIIYIYKNMFNIVTKKILEDNKIWVLPIKEKYSLNTVEKILKKEAQSNENIYLVSNNLKENKICLIMDKHNVKYITEEKIKKYLIFETLKYILNLSEKQLSDIEITLLVNNVNSINMYLIEQIAKLAKNLKIVSVNIYKFKNLEEKLYNECGIPIQFSNNYRKSLEKSKIIINFDFNEFEINEYEIFNKAIIINCTRDNIIIKKRLFNGIVVNSYEITYKEKLINKFKKMDIYENYSKLMLCASIIEEKNIENAYEILKEYNVKINALIGNNGVLCKKEVKKGIKDLFALQEKKI